MVFGKKSDGWKSLAVVALLGSFLPLHGQENGIQPEIAYTTDFLRVMTGADSVQQSLFLDNLDVVLTFDAMVLDLDAAVTMIPNLTVDFEFNQWLGQTFEDTLTSKMGWLAMANYGIGDFGITFRQDTGGKSSSTTISPSYGIAERRG